MTVLAVFVTKISKLSPTHFVSTIRHQHRCSQLADHFCGNNWLVAGKCSWKVFIAVGNLFISKVFPTSNQLLEVFNFYFQQRVSPMIQVIFSVYVYSSKVDDFILSKSQAIKLTYDDGDDMDNMLNGTA